MWAKMQSISRAKQTMSCNDLARRFVFSTLHILLTICED